MAWGYGYFSRMAGEHLNKMLKEVEYEETNFSSLSLFRKARVRAFFLPFHIVFVAECGQMFGLSATWT